MFINVYCRRFAVRRAAFRALRELAISSPPMLYCVTHKPFRHRGLVAMCEISLIKDAG
jgi:hypothetical protein